MFKVPHDLVPVSISALVTHCFTLYFSIKEFNILNISEHSIYTELFLASIFLLYFSEFPFLPSIPCCSQTTYSSLRVFREASSSRDILSITMYLMQLTECPTKNSLTNTELKIVCLVALHPQTWHKHTHTLGSRMTATAPASQLTLTASKGIQRELYLLNPLFYEGEESFQEASTPRRISCRVHWPEKFFNFPGVKLIKHLPSALFLNVTRSPSSFTSDFVYYFSNIYWILLNARCSAKHSKNIILFSP